jgi:flagellar basal-body rod protein FlgB
MRFDIDNLLGIHAKAMTLRARRTEVLASNLANADTPGFKARDLDFHAMMRSAGNDISSQRLLKTNARHIGLGRNEIVDDELMYRTPTQPSLDGNTVDAQVEKAAFSENAVQYMASLQFLNGRIQGLKLALRGE